MPYKTILVHMDTTARCAVRVQLALDLAKKHGGRVHACMAQMDPNRSMIDPVHRASDRLKQEYERVKNEVSAQAEAAGVEIRFSMSPLITSANVVHYLVRAARHSDIVVMGQYDRETDKGVVPEDMTEQVIINAGRPVLVVPYAGEFPKLTDHVMVAWNAGREAAAHCRTVCRSWSSRARHRCWSSAAPMPRARPSTPATTRMKWRTSWPDMALPVICAPRRRNRSALWTCC